MTPSRRAVLSAGATALAVPAKAADPSALASLVPEGKSSLSLGAMRCQRTNSGAYAYIGKLAVPSGGGEATGGLPPA